MSEFIIILLIILGLGSLFIRQQEPEPEPEPEPTPIKEPDPPFTIGPYTGIRIARPEQHHLIWAPTGQGKSEFAKALLLEQLPKWQRKEIALVVIDTKGDLIDDILEAAEFCTKRTVLIDPRHFTFNLGFIDFKNIDPIGTTSLFITALGSVDADMTTKQQTLFTNIFKLLQHVPDANVFTIAEILRKGSETKFKKYVSHLDDFGQAFFTDLYWGSREFNETKDQVYRRLFALFEDPTLREAFTHKPVFEFTKAFDDAALILVNVSTQKLRMYAPAFGRFIMARILHAIENRPGRGRALPVQIYADEANVYLDDNAADIFLRARSANVGITPIMPTTSELSTTLRDVMLENTRTKTVGALTTSNARRVLETLSHKPHYIEYITRLGEGCVATFSNHSLSYTHVPGDPSTGDAGFYSERYYHASTNFIGAFKKNTTHSTRSERQMVIDHNRHLYGVQPTTPRQKKSTDDDPTIPEHREI